MLAHFTLKLLSKLSGKNKLSILIYHGVLASFDPLRPNEPTISSFSWQMEVLNKYFVPLSLPEALRLLQAGTLPTNAVCVTFDDGYKNNLEVALPILKQFAIPATVFVATAFSQGQNMWNDRVIQLFADKSITTLDLSIADLGVCELGDWPERKQLANTLLKKLKYLPIEERLEKIARLYRANGGVEAPSLMMTPDEVPKLSDAGVLCVKSMSHDGYCPASSLALPLDCPIVSYIQLTRQHTATYFPSSDLNIQLPFCFCCSRPLVPSTPWS